MQKSKYLVANENDLRWGLTISTVGYEEIGPGDPYPTKGHADGYYFDVEKGRTLNEFQLLYVMEGEGTFCSSHLNTTKIREGDLFLLFPGEWHTYSPCREVGWKSYWIGFSGRNMDDRVEAGLLGQGETHLPHWLFKRNRKAVQVGLRCSHKGRSACTAVAGRHCQPSHRHDVCA